MSNHLPLMTLLSIEAHQFGTSRYMKIALQTRMKAAGHDVDSSHRDGDMLATQWSARGRGYEARAGNIAAYSMPRFHLGRLRRESRDPSRTTTSM